MLGHVKGASALARGNAETKLNQMQKKLEDMTCDELVAVIEAKLSRQEIARLTQKTQAFSEKVKATFLHLRGNVGAN